MTIFQQTFLVIYTLFGLAGVYFAYRKCRLDKNNLGMVGIFIIYGAFVWADMIVFGLFWAIFTVVTILLSDWTLFLFAQSVFWFVRSIGEATYWFNQQFSQINRNPVKYFIFAKIFDYDDYTVWFVMQIIMQCIAVISAILSVYFGKLWIDNL